MAPPLGWRASGVDPGGVWAPQPEQRAAGGQTVADVRVLIVDDQAPFRSAARSLVQRLAGWRVVGEAATGEDALTEFETVRPDVVLMDINLPGIDGIEATRRIVAEAPDAVVVLLSTYSEQDLPEDARGCGAVAYVSKDALTPGLLRTVSGH